MRCPPPPPVQKLPRDSKKNAKRNKRELATKRSFVGWDLAYVFSFCIGGPLFQLYLSFSAHDADPAAYQRSPPTVRIRIHGAGNPSHRHRHRHQHQHQHRHRRQLKPALPLYPPHVRHSSRHETRPHPAILPIPNPSRTVHQPGQPRPRGGPGRGKAAGDGVSTAGDARTVFFVVYPERDGEAAL